MSVLMNSNERAVVQHISLAIRYDSKNHNQPAYCEILSTVRTSQVRLRGTIWALADAYLSELTIAALP